MHTWQSLLLNGNECFDAHNWHEAQRYYLKAIELLDLALQKNVDEPLLFAWICGYHNLSELYKQQGQLERATQTLLIPHQAMLHNLKKTDVKSQQLALKGIKITLPPILQWAQEHPSCDSCFNELIQQSKLIQQQVMNLH